LPKCKLVVRGFDEPNTTNKSTYSPTPSPVTLRIALVIAAEKSYSSVHIDFNAAFLNSKIQEEEHLYVYPPKGIHAQGLVYQLLGGLYGLSSSPLRWFLLVSKYLRDFDLTQHDT
jgi:hypothetical protein